MAEQKKVLDPQSNTINISTRKDTRFFMYLSKLFLRKFETIELHALGEAISISSRVSESLSRYGYANMSRINLQTITTQQKEGGRNDKQGQRKKVKLTIIMNRSGDFFNKVNAAGLQQ
eukprot:TRINITY_DN0_c2052_g1_i2.p1 TRINITY_DN0_c2052_g1~~TRINITY_DN0_c2052_g1_i2.p1  ORF type:complete len:118 (-),score=21.01 TRINITY_DN0_c2052_g1_i2:87-440(-)